MSDGTQAPVLAALPAALFDGCQGFRRDRRFAGVGTGDDAPCDLPEEPHPCAEPVAEEPEDPLHRAWQDGFSAGEAEARAAAEQRAASDAAARAALSLSLARLDSESIDLLRRRLHDIVVALCEETLRPLALDHAALAGRVERAVGLLARADDERTVRLHPQDIPLLDPEMRASWQIVPDPALERGAVRIETPSGGVEDGPGEWRRTIDEALAQ